MKQTTKFLRALKHACAELGETPIFSGVRGPINFETLAADYNAIEFTRGYERFWIVRGLVDPDAVLARAKGAAR